MTNNLKPTNVNTRKTDLEAQINSLNLEEQMNLVLTTPWEKRYEIITASSQAKEIVSNMPVEELFWTIKATGVEDSAILLNLSTPEQLQFIFDLDWWHKDNLRPEKVAAWLLVMYELNEKGLQSWLKWLFKKDPWLLPAMLNEFVRVVKRPDEMDIQEARDVLPPFTLDNVYFVDFKKKKLAPLFIRLISTLVELDPGVYRDVFETMLWETPSYNLETAYRLRCGRIGDFGIPDYYQSLDIYVPMEQGQMHTTEAEKILNSLPVSFEMPPFVPTLYVSGYPVLEEALRSLSGKNVMERIIRETTGIANKVIMADQVDLDDPKQLKNALKKSFSLINLGTEKIMEESGKEPASIIATHFMEEIVRLAAGLLLPVGSKARKLIASRGFEALPHHLRQYVEAASKRPAEAFDPVTGKTGPVVTISELEHLRKKVHEAETWQKIGRFLRPAPEKWKDGFDWQNTNFLAMEEFAIDSALATAVANLLIQARFETLALDRDALSRLLERLKELKGQAMEKNLEELLSPLVGGDEDNITETDLRQIIIPHLAQIFQDVLEGGENYLKEPRYLTHLLVSVSEG